MKKVKKFLKRNIKIVIAFTLGLLISGVAVYATTSYPYDSNDVGFDNTTANLTLNGEDVETVQDALDALYVKATSSSGCASGYIRSDETSGYTCAQQVVITLNPNGGSVSNTSATLTLPLNSNSTTYGTLPIPTLTDYVFAGWWTAETGGTKITSNTVFTYGTSATTLWAHWNKGGVDELITKVGSDGLVAIASTGALCSSCTVDNAREIRYSGAETGVNNWIEFAGEYWRIIGIFKGETTDGADKWNMKIIREEALPAPSSTTYASTSSGSKTLRKSSSYTYSVSTGSHSKVQKSYTAGIYYWNSGGTNSGIANWKNAGVQAYLNDESNTASWYYNTFKTNGALGVSYEQYIATTKYYINLFDVDTSATPSTAYTHEREGTKGNIYGATWSGKIGLLYASDYGYASDSSIWNGTSTLMSNYCSSSYSIKTKNWLLRNNDSSQNYWTITPINPYGRNNYALAIIDGCVSGSNVAYSDGHDGWRYGYAVAVRPVLSLKSDTPIIDGTGAWNDPYKIIVGT